MEYCATLNVKNQGDTRLYRIENKIFIYSYSGGICSSFDLLTKNIENHEYDGEDNFIVDSLDGTSRMIKLYKYAISTLPSDVSIREEKLTITSPTTIEDLSQAKPGALASCSWILGKIHSILNREDRGLVEDQRRKIQFSLESPPSFWHVSFNGFEIKFISDREPVVVVQDELHYIFIHTWNNRIEVHKEVVVKA